MLTAKEKFIRAIRAIFDMDQQELREKLLTMTTDPGVRKLIEETDLDHEVITKTVLKMGLSRKDKPLVYQLLLKDEKALRGVISETLINSRDRKKDPVI